MKAEINEQKSSSSSSNSIFKKIERYLSSKKHPKNLLTRSRSCHTNAKAATPNGYFAVYVGPEKQKFFIKTEFANHPLFKMVLEDAELEYGLKVDGPLLLPCDVDLFYKVLAEMEGGDDQLGYGYGCGSPFRRMGKGEMAKGCGSYGLLTPPRLLAKMNNS